MNYRIRQIDNWIVVNTSGKAQNNEPLRVEHLFHEWLTMEGIRVIINLKELARFGVCEVGLLASFRREVHRRNGVLRLCSLNPKLDGYFRQERFLEQFELYVDLAGALQEGSVSRVGSMMPSGRHPKACRSLTRHRGHNGLANISRECGRLSRPISFGIV